jgi:fatty acid desaturase
MWLKTAVILAWAVGSYLLLLLGALAAWQRVLSAASLGLAMAGIGFSVGWYLGGLNFQVEHHLFPKVCHVHYPALSRIVEEKCATHGVRYTAQPTLRAAIASNVRWLRELGRPANPDAPAASPGSVDSNQYATRLPCDRIGWPLQS